MPVLTREFTFDRANTFEPRSFSRRGSLKMTLAAGRISSIQQRASCNLLPHLLELCHYSASISSILNSFLESLTLNSNSDVPGLVYLWGINERPPPSLGGRPRGS